MALASRFAASWESPNTAFTVVEWHDQPRAASLADTKRFGVFRHKGKMQRSDTREARFERLYREHAHAVLAYALRRTSLDRADDVAAETFLIAWRRLDDVVDGEGLPWLYAIAWRVLSTQRRWGHRQEALAARLAFERRDEAWVDDDGRGRAVVRALAELDEDDREVLMLVAWEGLSSREAAGVLGCSPTACRIRLHRARRRLRVRLAAREEVVPTSDRLIVAETKESP
jgi:RNA polymerase sigma-70 factor (ECF subfamily)